MTDFKAEIKMHQIRFRLGLCPRPRWGSLQCSPRPLAGFGGPLRGRGRGWAGLGKIRERGRERRGRRKWRGGKGRAPKLLLNQGPSEPCYATDRNGGRKNSDDSAVCRLDKTGQGRQRCLLMSVVMRPCCADGRNRPPLR